MGGRYQSMMTIKINYFIIVGVENFQPRRLLPNRLLIFTVENFQPRRFKKNHQFPNYLDFLLYNL